MSKYCVITAVNVPADGQGGGAWQVHETCLRPARANVSHVTRTGVSYTGV